MPTVYIFDFKESPFQMCRAQFTVERRVCQSIHEYNESLIQRDAFGLPIRRKLDWMLIHSTHKHPAAVGKETGRQFDKRTIEKHLRGERGKWDGKRW